VGSGRSRFSSTFDRDRSSRDMADGTYTISDYLLDRLVDLGVDRVFGVPGTTR